MNKGNTATEHYKNQRDLLAEYLLSIGVSKTKLGKILGIGRSAISQQFPDKQFTYNDQMNTHFDEIFTKHTELTVKLLKGIATPQEILELTELGNELKIAVESGDMGDIYD